MAKKEYRICDNKRWIDICDPSEEEMKSLSEEFSLDKFTVSDCMQPEHLPKYENVNEVDFLIIRFYAGEPNRNADTIQDLTNKIAIFYTTEFLITIHKYEIPFLQSFYEKIPASKNYFVVGEVVAKILWESLETFDKTVQYLSDQVNVHESNIILKKTEQGQVEALYHIKRQSSLALKVLMLMLEPINHVHTRSKEDPALQDVKDQHLKMETLYGQVLEDVNNLITLYTSFSELRRNEVVKVLTIFSAFFLPLTFIVGVYGMNFQHMPELTKRWGYPAVLLFMTVVTITIYIWFKRKKWM